MYIPQLFTALCIMLSAASAALTAAFFCCRRTARTDSDSKAIFLWFLVLPDIGQGIFAMMTGARCCFCCCLRAWRFGWCGRGINKKA